MNTKSSLRPGGRSARVQAAVHRAVQELDAEIGRASLTVPLVAGRAGVTPSTIYRRWGGLAELLTDVALGSLRAESAPDTGTVTGDLQAWAEQYLDEMTSPVGLALIQDVLASNRTDASGQCSVHVASQLTQIVERGLARAEASPTVEAFMDAVVAPIIYRALFGPVRKTREEVRALVEQCVAAARVQA
jgi:AcrR family transcriptional regulator